MSLLAVTGDDPACKSAEATGACGSGIAGGFDMAGAVDDGVAAGG